MPTEEEIIKSQQNQSFDAEDGDVQQGRGNAPEKKVENQEQPKREDNLLDFETTEQEQARLAKEKTDAENAEREKANQEPDLNENGEQKKDEQGNLLFKQKPANPDDDIFKLNEDQTKLLGFVNIEDISKKFNIELSAEEKSVEKLVEKLTTKLETASQKIELDKTKYDEPTRELFDFVENGGSAMDLIDVTKNFNDFFILPPEARMKYILMNSSTPLSEVAASQKIDEMKEDGSYESEVARITNEVKQIREDKVNEIVKNQKTLIANKKIADKQLEETEKSQMVEHLNKLDKFMNRPLPDDIKKFVALQIKTGEFHKEMNTASALVEAYLFKKYGPKIIAKYFDEAKVNNNKAHNEGFDKANKMLHQNADLGGQGGGHSASNPNPSRPFEGLKDVEFE